MVTMIMLEMLLFEEKRQQCRNQWR